MRFSSAAWMIVGVLCLTGRTHAEAVTEERAAWSVEGTYAGELLRQAPGGIRSGTRYIDSMALGIMIDGEALAGWNSLTAFLGVVHGNGETISDLSGARQGVSALEGTSSTRAAELWCEHSFGSGNQSLRVGLYDVGSEFSKIDSTDLFSNQSQIMTPELASSGANGPSMAPVTGIGMRYGARVGSWSARFAVLDGDPGAEEQMRVHLSRRDGALTIGELDYESHFGLRLGSGHWRYTARFADLRSTPAAPLKARRDNAGIYGFIESPVPIAARNDALHWSARLGLAAPRTNEIARSYSTGLTYSIRTRRPWRIGVAASVAELGAPARSARSHDNLRTTSREWGYEVSSGWQVSELLLLKANVEHIVHPGMDPTLEAAWIYGLRFEVARQWRW